MSLPPQRRNYGNYQFMYDCKNESAVLARCLDSIADLMDEIIIVDTCSTDNTKEIAAQYTSRIYDFKWTSDFSAARNFSFSKATMEYIYTADADEILTTQTASVFRLKGALLPEIEIVQMKYVTQGTFDTVLNAKRNTGQSCSADCARLPGSIRFTRPSA